MSHPNPRPPVRNTFLARVQSFLGAKAAPVRNTFLARVRSFLGAKAAPTLALYRNRRARRAPLQPNHDPERTLEVDAYLQRSEAARLADVEWPGEDDPESDIDLTPWTG